MTKAINMSRIFVRMHQIVICLAALSAFVVLGPMRPALAVPSVIVSIAPQKYLVERIAADAVTVTALVNPGADPHSYEPTPAQMRACAEAALYLSIGVPFEEAWLPRITSSAKNLRVASTIKGLTRLSGNDDALRLADLMLKKGIKSAPTQKVEPHKQPPAHKDHDHDGEDPHVWLSPMFVRGMLPGMAKELGKLVPEKAVEFRANAEKLSAEFEALDAELAKRFAGIPAEKRVFLTFHPAWRYFAHNYELTELSIEVEGKEPGPKTMKQVIDTAKTFGITTIFIEPQFSQATARAVAANIGAKVVVIDPLAHDLPTTMRRFADELLASFAGKAATK